MFHGETRIPKVVTFTETRTEPPTFGHTHMPDHRGMSLGGSGGNEAIEELTKPHYGKDHLSGRTVQDDEQRHENEYVQRVRPSQLQKLVKKYDGST